MEKAALKKLHITQKYYEFSDKKKILRGNDIKKFAVNFVAE